MIQVILQNRLIEKQLYPFAEIRQAVDIRVGIYTIREKWEKLCPGKLSLVHGSGESSADPKDPTSFRFPSNAIPSKSFIEFLLSGTGNPSTLMNHEGLRILQFPWQIAELNDWALREDFKLITAGRNSAPIPETVMSVKSGAIFLEEGANLAHCMLNAETGPIYIGPNTEIMEGSHIRGPFALCEGGVVKMGTRIYGATTIGPQCVVGGEIKNSVFFGYSNKAHDGYIGDSVIGEWCNLGAGTSNSNLKNTAGEVMVWSASEQKYIRAGRKCGLLMGDYSKCAINTSFNTGTLTGIAANIFGVGLTPKYIPDFAWGAEYKEKADWQKSIAAIGEWKKMKNKSLTHEEIQQLKSIFDNQ